MVSPFRKASANSPRVTGSMSRLTGGGSILFELHCSCLMGNGDGFDICEGTPDLVEAAARLGFEGVGDFEGVSGFDGVTGLKADRGLGQKLRPGVGEGITADGGPPLDVRTLRGIRSWDCGVYRAVALGGTAPALEGGWINPALEGGWINPALEGGWINPALEGGWINPALEGGWINPALEGGWINPALEGGWIKPALEGGWIKPVVEGAGINPAVGGARINPELEGDGIKPAAEWGGIKPAVDGAVIKLPAVEGVGVKLVGAVDEGIKLAVGMNLVAVDAGTNPVAVDAGTKPLAVEAKTGISGTPNSLSQIVMSSIMSACDVALVPDVPTAATGVVWNGDAGGTGMVRSETVGLTRGGVLRSTPLATAGFLSTSDTALEGGGVMLLPHSPTEGEAEGRCLTFLLLLGV